MSPYQPGLKLFGFDYFRLIYVVASLLLVSMAVIYFVIDDEQM